jgi:hypothetical protein
MEGEPQTRQSVCWMEMDLVRHIADVWTWVLLLDGVLYTLVRGVMNYKTTQIILPYRSLLFPSF